MFSRQMGQVIQKLRKTMPIVTILGPRQSGKTTLAKTVFPEKPYVNFEQLDLRLQALEDPKGFLQRYPKGAIFDEIQEAPALLSYLLPFVDEIGLNDLFVLTGSHQTRVKEGISQSLAGRTAILKLYPLSLQELGEHRRSLEEAILFGGYPRAQSLEFPLTNLFSSYYQTYVERDISSLSRIHNLNQFALFVRLLAGRIGQLVNLESLGGDVGISSSTVKEWISLLEASHILFRLHPYYENFGKRLIKSCKIYFTDTGLACYLLGIENQDQLQRDPLKGSLFENLIVLELMKARSNQGLDPNLYFYRDRQGKEVDVIYQKGRELIPIEIKSSSTYNSSFLDTLLLFQQIAEKRTTKSFLIYGGQEGKVHNTMLLPWQDAASALIL
ncbi:MAG: ATP-binding protein [Chlamydiales bacterium]|nr:ATP-binding protein [Chlamydiales bacterium]